MFVVFLPFIFKMSYTSEVFGNGSPVKSITKTSFKSFSAFYVYFKVIRFKSLMQLEKFRFIFYHEEET